jgi:hypothetical protein
MIEVDVAMVRIDQDTKTPIVFLREKVGKTKRLLPIWVGFFEAIAIIMELENQPVARPMTHDLLKNVIDNLGAKVTSVLVSDLQDNTFYAEITISSSGGDVVKIDARPSDSMALALRTDAPIYVSEDIMAKNGISSEFIKMDDKEQLKAVLENLGAEDFGKFKI